MWIKSLEDVNSLMFPLAPQKKRKMRVRSGNVLLKRDFCEIGDDR